MRRRENQPLTPHPLGAPLKAYDRARGVAAVLAAALAADPSPQDPFELEALDELPFVQIPHWVPLAVAALTAPSPAMKAGAIALYNFLAMHLSMNRDDRYVWPTRDTLAALMGYSRADKISPFVNLLIQVDALVVIKVPNGAGPEQRNVYRLRRNPPPNFTGHVLMSQIYAAAEVVVAGGSVHPDMGVDAHPDMGADVHPDIGAVTTTTPNKNKEQLAPPARSAPDARRATAGSSAREDSSGCAATIEPGPVAGEGVEAEPAAPSAVPVKAGGQGAGKRSPFPPDVRDAIYATERLLPAELRAVLAETFPYGHLPNANRKVIAQALETRTPEELGERAARRWTSYGYERDYHDGLLRSPLGVVEELLRPTPYCPDPECEDGLNRATAGPCVPCEARVARRLADRRAGRPVPTQRPPRLYRHAEQCQVCDQPFREDAPDDRVCARCRSALDRAAAHAAGAPLPAPEPDPDPDHCAAPPSDEYRRYRQQRAAAKTAAGSPGPAPF